MLKTSFQEQWLEQKKLALREYTYTYMEAFFLWVYKTVHGSMPAYKEQNSYVRYDRTHKKNKASNHPDTESYVLELFDGKDFRKVPVEMREETLEDLQDSFGGHALSQQDPGYVDIKPKHHRRENTDEAAKQKKFHQLMGLSTRKTRLSRSMTGEIVPVRALSLDRKRKRAPGKRFLPPAKRGRTVTDSFLVSGSSDDRL